MPAVGNFVLDKGRVPESALFKYRACKAGSGEESVTACTADTDLIEGVTQFAVSAGELAKDKRASVRLEGITPWEAGGAITKGALVGIDSVGRCIALATGKRGHGRALMAAGASGDQITVELNRNSAIAP
jgi:Uncharacterized conserved protein (DUF2190)